MEDLKGYNTQGKNRLRYVDIAKGIGILLVILGHMPSVVPLPVRLWIFSFHMPLFFFLAGMFAKDISNPKELAAVIIKKAKLLILKGYWGYALAFLLLDMIIYGMDRNSACEVIKNVFWGTTDRIYWFFICLFLVSVLFSIITMLVKNMPLRVVIMLGLAFAGMALGRTGVNYWRVGSALYSAGFYYAGVVAVNYGIIERCLEKKWIILCAFLISVIVSGLIIRFWNIPILDISINYSIDVCLNYILAFSGIAFILFISRQFDRGRSNVLRIVLGYIGMHSFFFFPITNYVPAAFCHLVNKENALTKGVSYIAGFLVSYMISEVACAIKKKTIDWKSIR